MPLSEWRAKLPCISGRKHNLSAYLDGELDESARSGVEDHLARCHSCRAVYNELRFASRAISHFAVPEAIHPLWRDDRMARRSQEAATIPALKRCWAMKVAIPAPVFGAGLLAVIILAAWLLLSRQMQTTTVTQSTNAESATTTKIIQVPVEREVVRERVVTRIVYARRSRLYGTGRRPSVAEELPGSTLIAERRPVGRNTNGVTFTRASLAGFRPATTADLRIVKEPEQ